MTTHAAEPPSALSLSAASEDHGRAWRITPTSGVLLLLGLCLVVVQLRDLLGFSQRYVDEDGTLLWDAGEELLHLHLHTPNFWGQTYFTVFEALPGALLHAVGVSLNLADPLGTTLIVTLSWVAVALASYRRGHVLSAALALALPACLSIPYLLLADQPRGNLTGDLLAALAVAASVYVRPALRRLGTTVLLGTTAIVWDNASAIAVAPTLLALIAAELPELNRRRGRALLTAAAGALPAVAITLADRHWYATRPGYEVSSAAATNPSLATLWQHILHPGPLFGFYEPEIIRAGGWLALIMVAGLILTALAVAGRRRRIEPAAAAAGLVIALLAVLAAQDTAWNFIPNLYLSGARFLELMPLGAWAVLHWTLVTQLSQAPRTPVGRVRLLTSWPVLALATVSLVTVISTVTSQVSFGSQLRGLVVADGLPSAGVTVQGTTALLSQCAAATKVYRQVRPDLLVTADRTFAYLCAAQGDLNTLFPAYDRRAWLVNAAYTQPSTRILLWGGIACQSAPATVGTCRDLGNGAELLTTPPRPAAVTLAGLGMPVFRPAV